MGDLAEFAQRRLLAAQLRGELREAFVDLRVGRHQGFAQIVEVHLGATVEQGREQGDADGAAEVAQDVEQARGRAGILWLQVGGGDQRNGHHDHRLAEGAQ